MADLDYLKALRELPPLPKPHPSTQTDAFMWTRDPDDVAMEFYRICGVVSCQPWQMGEDLAQYGRVRKVASLLKIPIAANFHPYGYRVPDVFADQAAQAKCFNNARGRLPNLKFVYLDYEYSRRRPDLVEWTRECAAKNFPDALVTWYANGQFVREDRGWRADSYGTETASPEIAAPNLYEKWDRELMYQKICYARLSRAGITPTVSLGGGWTRPTWDTPSAWGPYNHDSYELWRLSLAINYPGWPYPGNADIEAVWLHPHPLDAHNGVKGAWPEALREFVVWAHVAYERAPATTYRQ